jgi:hypothetical protein
MKMAHLITLEDHRLAALAELPAMAECTGYELAYEEARQRFAAHEEFVIEQPARNIDDVIAKLRLAYALVNETADCDIPPDPERKDQRAVWSALKAAEGLASRN